MQAYSSLLQILQNEIKVQENTLNSLSPKEMYEPMSYIISLGGKRIRPLLTLVGCDLFDSNPAQAIHAAMAVELFHNFSLIHDDILDKAPLRRGNETVHEKWSHNIGLLSGDGMLVKAFEQIALSHPTQIVDLLKVFTQTSIEVCEGQQYDMNFESIETISIDEYIKMITFKTAVLLGCSLQMGAICANASTQNQMHLYEFGKHIGIAFQILDDVLDVYADDSKFGKQVGGDIIANKKTFLLLKALELSNNEQLCTLKNLINNTDVNSVEKVKQVTDIYNQLSIKELASAEANKHTDIALNHLDELNVNQTKKQQLKQFALHLLNRDI